MAKNTFLIRTRVNLGHAESYNQTELDLGSYTNLGSSKPEVLKIITAHFYIQDSVGKMPSMGANKAGELAWQLTTSSQSGIVSITDDSFLMGGMAGLRNPDSAINPPSQAFSDTILPQQYSEPQTVAVPSLFLGGICGDEFEEDVYLGIVLECKTSPMSKADAVSLAVSQQ